MIGQPEVLEALRAVVAEKGPNYVYPEPACVYAISRKPSCIVGHVYARFGLLDQATRDSIAPALRLHNDKISCAGRVALDSAQKVQDGVALGRRGTWGEALAAAEAEWREMEGS